ncbi:hypothetical protein AB0L25_38995 [Spirillospora sp. NPDC052242]
MYLDPDESTAAQNTVGAAEAWHRVRQHLPGDNDQPILLHVQEFEDGFLVLPVVVELPEPPPVPDIDTVTTFVVDKATGTVTRWPLLKFDILTDQYRRYRRGEPLTYDEPTP